MPLLICRLGPRGPSGVMTMWLSAALSIKSRVALIEMRLVEPRIAGILCNFSTCATNDPSAC